MIQFSWLSCLVVSDSLWPHGLQHTRPPCPPPTTRFTQTHVHWVGDAIQPSHPLSSPSLPAFNLSQHQDLFFFLEMLFLFFFFSFIFISWMLITLQYCSGFFEPVLYIRWPKYSCFSFSISPSDEYSGLISFRMDWLGLLAVQGTLKSLLQHHSSKASVLLCSAFFIVQLSHQYMTTGKTIALTRWTFVGKVMSLLFNILSRLVITFLSRSKRLLIS